MLVVLIVLTVLTICIVKDSTFFNQ